MLKVINTDETTGGKGKSNALNIGFQSSIGEYIVIYDADNTPDKKALRYLVYAIQKDPGLGAVIGKFRTRNRNVNMLTRFVNKKPYYINGWHKQGVGRCLKCAQSPEPILLFEDTLLKVLAVGMSTQLLKTWKSAFEFIKWGIK